ncbi:MAG: DUF2339 domain-containing protein, partial [Planctomycetota bacterium]|nr:DUF2339 domain-containing protein [Planctomycetota bacterium]
SLLVGGAVLGIIAFFQNRGLRRRIIELEEREASTEDSAVEAEPERPELVPAESSVPEQTIRTPSPAKESTPPKKRIEWEKLLGVQGAAILGGIVLLFTAVLFFKYAIDEGWFDRQTRVWTGLITGTLCLLIQAKIRTKGYRVVSDVLAGSGAVIHYASAWAAFRLYHLISQPVGFGWMVVITALCCWLAVRHSAQLIAIFGLVGGFATPLLLATTSPSAIGLFGYVLLLDMALLAIGRKKDWPWLGLLGLFGTTGSQVLWLMTGREEEAAIGLLACGLFGFLFVFMGSPESGVKQLRWQLGRIAGVMIPFAIAIHYAQLVELGDNFLVIVSVTTLLSGAATYVGRRLTLPGLSLAAAASAAAVASTWLFARPLDEGALTSFALLTGATSVILAVIDARTRREEPGKLHPAAIHSLVLLFSLAYIVSFSSDLSLWGVLLTAGVHLSLTIISRASLPALPALAGLATGFTLLMYRVQHVHPGNPYYHDAPALLLGVVLFSGALLAASIKWRAYPSHRALALAAFLCATPSLAYFRDWYGANAALFYGALSLIALVAACGAARTTSSIAYGAAVFLISWALYSGTDVDFYVSREWSIPSVLPWLYLGIAIATLAPLLSRQHLFQSRAMGLLAAFAPFLAIGRMLELHEHHFGERGALLILAALALLPALAYKLLTDANEGSKRAKTVYLVSACSLLAFAIPAELRDLASLGPTWDHRWVYLGLALSGAAASFIAKSRASSASSIAAHLAVSIAALELSALALDLDRIQKESQLLLNWISYAYGVSLLSCLFVLKNTAAGALEAKSYRRYLAGCTGGLTCLLGFACLNLLLINGYTDGDRLDIQSQDLNRDLVLSLSWALYSFSLLAIGAKCGIAALRWASLAFLFATIVKVFLFDLGNLDGLQRVGSFFGLAVCLILVSLFYSRFVFRNDETKSGHE